MHKSKNSVTGGIRRPKHPHRDYRKNGKDDDLPSLEFIHTVPPLQYPAEQKYPVPTARDMGS
jgi:hypothetical protein